MAFGNISTFYLPTAANAGTSQWGTDVRKLLDSADTGNDKTTKTDHGTGGSVTRTLDPYTTKATNDTEDNFGWAVMPSDMNSVAGARRFIPAGDHVFTIRTASDTSSSMANSSYTLYVYRVGPSPGRTRTLLGSQSGGAFNYGLIANTYRTETVTINLPEIVFEADETIQYSIEQASPGTAITGRTNTHDTGTQGGIAIRVDHPGLFVLHNEELEAIGVGTASQDSLTVSEFLEASGIGTADMTKLTSALVSLEAEGIGTADEAHTITLDADGEGLEAVGIGTADARLQIDFDDVPTGGAGTTKKPIYIFPDED